MVGQLNTPPPRPEQGGQRSTLYWLRSLSEELFVPQYLAMSVIEGADDEQAVGKLDVLLRSSTERY